MIDLNDIAVPKTLHDLAAVKERLICTAADWLPGLFPEARLARDRRSLRCADLSGRPPRKEGSCTIHLDGPYAGWGFDYATGERAGPIDLIAQATGLCDGALFDEAARLARMDHPAPWPAPSSPMRVRPDHSAEIARLVGGAVPIAGTPGETYLRARGLSDPGSPNLLFHPDLPDFDSCRGWPGLIAILRLPDGTCGPGIHRTFLLDDGSAKAPPGKKMLGSVKDAAVRLFPMPENGHIGIAEGIETALAAHALFGTPVWAALSADGLARFQWPEGTRRVTIYADAGDVGRQAGATLSDRLNRADIPNEMVAPLHGDDFNDDLQRGARAENYMRGADTTAERGAHLRIARLAIDTGYEAPAVYSWSRAQGFGQVSPVKGVEGFNRSSPVSGPTFVDATEGGKRLRRGARLWTVAVSTFKAETYRFLRLARPTEEGEAGPSRQWRGVSRPNADGATFPPGSVHLPHWVENEWLKQFVAEQLVTVRTKRGFARLEWQKLRERNEALDCRVYTSSFRTGDNYPDRGGT